MSGVLSLYLLCRERKDDCLMSDSQRYSHKYQKQLILINVAMKTAIFSHQRFVLVVAMVIFVFPRQRV